MRRPDVSAGGPIWINLRTGDPDRAADFYGRLFSWTVLELNGRIFAKGDARIAGLTSTQVTDEHRNGWTLYLATTDTDQTLDAVPAAGGTVLQSAQELAGFGRAALVADPGGTAVGLCEPGGPGGFDLVAEPGAPCWFELRTSAYDACLRFYEMALAWPVRTNGAQSSRYATHGKGHSQRAGIRETVAFPNGDPTPGGWTISFGTASCDAAVQQVVAAGGAVLAPPQGSATGRMATVADPMGAIFGLVEVAAWPEERQSRASAASPVTETWL